MPPFLLVDGYNVVGAWPRLRKLRDKAQLHTARDRLLADVEEFAGIREWTCVLVWDAMTRGDGERSEITPGGVEVVFTGSETADSFIERQVFEHCEEGLRQVWVVTSDCLEGRFSQAKGAHVMSSTLFIQELKRARKETKELAESERSGGAGGKMLISCVDEETRGKLYELRDRLDEGQG